MNTAAELKGRKPATAGWFGLNSDLEHGALPWHYWYKSADRGSRSKLWRGDGKRRSGEPRSRSRSRERLHGKKADRNDRTEKTKLSVIITDCSCSGKNRRRGGCSYGCARLCNFGKQIAAINTRNMKSFELIQKTCQKKIPKTIHKLEYKSRTRIRLRSLLGDLGRRSSWALGVGHATGPKYRHPTPQVVVDGMVWFWVELYCLDATARRALRLAFS